jgi:hypothetical protein
MQLYTGYVGGNQQNKVLYKEMRYHFFIKCGNKQGYVTEINSEWEVLQVYGLIA